MSRTIPFSEDDLNELLGLGYVSVCLASLADRVSLDNHNAQDSLIAVSQTFTLFSKKLDDFADRIERQSLEAHREREQAVAQKAMAAARLLKRKGGRR